MREPHSWADIDTDALRHNLQRARMCAPGRRVCAVIKANAYGHGVHTVARALQPVLLADDLFAVATLNEALTLRRTASRETILVLRGPLDAEELAVLIHGGFHWVLHSRWQAEMLKSWLHKHLVTQQLSLNIWLKINTGMNRLGVPEDDLHDIWPWLQSLKLPGERVLMSHFATADEHEHVLAAHQQTEFDRIVTRLPDAAHCSRSLSASAGIVSWPQAHHDIVRPGIMLYGASPMADTDGSHYNLKPVMSLKARLLTINHVKAGDTVGYGATYHCQKDTPIGVIGIGYGDGYPRHAPSGTPVMIYAQGKVWEAPLAGRVSMDMLTVDLTGIPASPGDEVLLWGQAWGSVLPADRIARYAGTIAYELFCQITSRVRFNS